MRLSIAWVMVVSLIYFLSNCRASMQAQGADTRAADPNVWPGQAWQTTTGEPGTFRRGARRRRGVCRNTAAAAAASSGTATSSRSGAIRRSWPTSSRRPRGRRGDPPRVGRRPGLVKLDDAAMKHYPTIGGRESDNFPDRLAEITIRHLATMTAGFDDGRPPKLVYRPGTDGFYSNDCANMLAELFTLRFGKTWPRC